MTHVQTEVAPGAQETRRRRAWKMMNEEKFDEVFTEEVTRLGNHRLLLETDIDRTVEALTTAIYKAIDLLTLWARLSIQVKPWWTPEC